MTSHDRRDNDHSMFTSKTPPFFKVILEETIRDGKLGIPRKFVRDYGKQLSRSIQLEVPSGTIWQVELTKCDERVWLQKGWKEFVEHHSLQYGHFVVFRYEGTAHFHVLIFDRSASEIQYPYTSTENDDDMSVELTDDVSASRKCKEKSHLPCPRPLKKMRTDQLGTDDPKSRRIKLANLKKVEKSCCSTRQLDATKGAAGITARRSAKTEVFSCVQRLTATEKAHAVQIAGAFKRTENPVFMVVMRPSIVRYKYRLNGNLTLCNSGGKTWPAKYYCSAENKKPNAQLHGGWRAFAEDNKLDVGDICVFELIKHPEILMKVVIYPVVENASKACIPLANGSIAGRVKIRSIVSDTELNCGQSRCPSSSREFKDPKFKENEKIHPCIEILDDFPLKQKTKKKLPSPCFQPWKMMGTNPIRSIQATKGIGITAPRSVKTEVLSCAQRLTATEKAHAIQRASAFKSTENPVLYVVMQPSFVSCNYRMIIPLDFTRRFLTMQHGNLTLCNSNGKTWPVEYYRTAENKKPKAYIHGGWRAFVEDNNLDVGDICVFELIKHPEILMKVVIYPVVENASKACRSLAHGSIDSRVKIRSLVSDTELDCWQSQCPSSSRESKDSKIEENENIHSSIEISDDFLLNQKKKMKSPSPCFQPCSMMRTNPSGSIQAKGIKLEKQKKSVDFQYSTKELRGEFKYCAKEDSREMSDACRCLKPDLLGKIQPLTPTEKERACIRASGLKSANPSFTVMMHPSYVLTGGSLNIPYQFAKRYFKKNGGVTLRVSDGRTWIVDYKRKVSRLSAKAKFHSNSWRSFVLDNNLKVGDICVFELIKENGTLFEVFILSAADIASSSSSRLGTTKLY